MTDDIDDGPTLKARAVAVRRDEPGTLPRITASGRGYVAEKILDIAFASGVKVRRDEDLAQLLAQLEVDSPIPLEALTAVSQILTYVYRANGELDEPASGPDGD